MDPYESSVKYGVGSLLVGYYSDDNRLVFAGKVGTGIHGRDRNDLKEQFKSISRKKTHLQRTSETKCHVSSSRRWLVKSNSVNGTDDGKLRHPHSKD